THAQNFTMVKSLSEVLDAGWASLMNDLKSRGLLDSTLIVWMGEFGRTPTINGARGRDHYPNAWSTVLAGGGIKGGQAVGKTSADGTTIEERPVEVPDFLSTVCLALGLDASSPTPPTSAVPSAPWPRKPGRSRNCWPNSEPRRTRGSGLALRSPDPFYW